MRTGIARPQEAAANMEECACMSLSGVRISDALRAGTGLSSSSELMYGWRPEKDPAARHGQEAALPASDDRKRLGRRASLV